jgi:two-component system OmpR family response regulator
VRVLVVEDEPDLASVIARVLTDAGWSADTAGDGETALAMVRDDVYDLIVLDLMLPDVAGDEILASVRKHGRPLPVLVLTARDEVHDRVRLLDSGADDYVIKPFEPAELVSRCRALVRRAAGHDRAAITIDEIQIDLARRLVTRDGDAVALTPREFRVLEYLALHRGRVVSRQELMSHLYSDADDTWSNVLDVYVSSLRRKLRSDVIETRRGHGFTIPD